MLAGERALRSLAFEDALRLIESAIKVVPENSVAVFVKTLRHQSCRPLSHG
jgi:hypothetical protein